MEHRLKLWDPEDQEINTFKYMNSKWMIVFGLFAHPWCVRAQVEGTLQHDGQDRSYIYYGGQDDPEAPVALVFVLHGATQSGSQIADVSRMHEWTDDNTLVCYPDGIGNSWNVGLAFGSVADDVGFLDALADEFIQNHGADPLRIYFCGFSAGGYMSYRMVCESQHCIAAVASVAGTMVDALSESCVIDQPTPVMHIHGTSDFVVSYNGSVFAGLSVDEVMEHWTTSNGCSGSAVVENLDDIDPGDGSTVDKYLWSECEASGEVLLYKINGGGHTWPGTQALLGGVGSINNDINASQQIEAFFGQFSCGGLASQVSMTRSGPEFSVYPNPTNGLLFVEGTPVSVYVVNDVFGRSVLTGKIDGRQLVDLTALPAGVYIFSISGTKTFRVLKQ
jgi:polyhydroxybutyrate depolymerase